MTSEYEEAMRSLPPPKPLALWTEEEARNAATAAFTDTPDGVAAASALAEARRAARHAVTARRLAGIRLRRPHLADLIDSDFAWLRQSVVGFDRMPVREQVRHWYMVTGVPETGPSHKSTRGTYATWRGVREAAFVLLDWHRAARGTVPSSIWLAGALSDIEPALSRPSANGVARDRKVAREMIAAWRAEQPVAARL